MGLASAPALPKATRFTGRVVAHTSICQGTSTRKSVHVVNPGLIPKESEGEPAYAAATWWPIFANFVG
jgi:hypothetical protein